MTSGSDNLPFSHVDRARWKGALWLGPEVDVYYMRNRWYETGTGRFLSEDPLGLGGGINPLVFAGGDPVGGSDPMGLLPQTPYELGDVIATAPGPGKWPWGYTPLGLPTRPGLNGELLKRGGGGGGSGGVAGGHYGHNSREDRRPPKGCANLAGELLLSATLDAATFGWGRLVVVSAKGLKAGKATYEGYVAAKSFGTVFKGANLGNSFFQAIGSPTPIGMLKALPGVGTLVGIGEFAYRCL